MTDVSLLIVIVAVGCVFFAGVLGYQRGWAS